MPISLRLPSKLRARESDLFWSLLVLLIFVLQFSTSQTPTKCSRKNSLVNAADLTTLQFAQVIFRHGDRNPLDTYPRDPYKYPQYWPEGEGQLTKNGKLMAYELGQYLRWRYDGFLNSAYTNNEVFAKASDFDRTIMTGLSVLAGLYPPNEPGGKFREDVNWQPIPIRTISPADDHFIAFFFENCPRYQRLLFEVLDAPEVKRIDQHSKDLYEYLKRHTGLDTVGWKEVGLLYDTFSIQRRYGLKLPDWAKSVYPHKMWLLHQLGFKILSFTGEMRQLRGGPLLTEMINNMNSKIRMSTEPQLHNDNILATVNKNFRLAKLYLYSGHDTTITTFLATLDLYDYQHIPPYTSMVMFELHKDRDNGEYFVRIFYRNETNGKAAIELEIPNCIESCDGHQVCKFTKFKSLMAHFNITNWEEHCRVDGRASRSSSSNTQQNTVREALPRIMDAGAVIGQQLYDLVVEPAITMLLELLYLLGVRHDKEH